MIFKLFALRNIHKLSAIVMNYFTCFVLGYFLSGSPSLLPYFGQEWFWVSLSLGGLFVSIFFLMALTTEKHGISVNAVSSKMSVVVPLLLAYLLLHEHFNLWYALGIVLALLSILLISWSKKMDIDRHHLLLPLAVFLGSGVIDFSLKLLEMYYGQQVALSEISYTIFLGAFIIGLAILLYRYYMKYHSWSLKNSIAGIALGIPNYFSIWFLLEALAAFELESAMVFSINNVSIVLCSALLSLVIFREHLNKRKAAGLVLAIAAILIIAYAKG